MIMDCISIIIGFIWGLLCIPIPVDDFRFTTWQFFAFIILIAVIVNAIFRKKVKE